MDNKSTTEGRLWNPALWIAVGVLLLHLWTAPRYGYFGDELYFLACGEHLDWGYVDQPPMIGLVAWLVRHTLGTSLLAIRSVSALCAAVLVWLTARIAAELDGGRFAQARTALCAAFGGVYFLWGPRDYKGEVLVVVGSSVRDLETKCDRVEVAANPHHPYGAVWENGPVLVCRGLKSNLQEIWPKVKNWD